jgi:AraC-like DNA-binding protein
VQYRNTLRALEFLRLSEPVDANLTRAAIEAGFGSYSQCHRVFRSLFGLSPREYFLSRLPRRAELMERFEPLKAVVCV